MSKIETADYTHIEDAPLQLDSSSLTKPGAASAKELREIKTELELKQPPVNVPSLVIVDKGSAAPDAVKVPVAVVMEKVEGPKIGVERLEILPNGDGKGNWADGGAFTEHTNNVGARLRTNAEGQVERVTRRDGTVVSAAYEDGKPLGMSETKNGITTYWRPDYSKKSEDGKDLPWVSREAPGEERHNMAISSNGNLTFVAKGEQHIVRGNGAELIEGKGRATFDFDGSGRIDSIHYPDGSTTFGFKYKGNSEKIDAVTTHNDQTSESRTEVPDNTWGEPKLADDGTYSQYGYQFDATMSQQIFKGKQTFGTDGKFVVNTLQYDHSVALSDGYSNVTGSRAANSSDFVDQQPKSAKLALELPNLEISRNRVPSKPQDDTAGAIKVEKAASKPEQAEQVKPADKIFETTKAPLSNLDRARENLRAEAKSHGMDVERLDVFASAFEQRAKEAKRLGLEAPSGEQMAKTYNTFAEMLKGPAQPGGLSDENRADLVKLSMYNVAYPRRIDQGLNLCNVTTSEVYTASRNPENYARLIKEVSLTGDYTTTAGQKIHLPAGAIDRDPEQSKFTTENVGPNRWRNWASKVFQETGINSVVPFLPASANSPAWGRPHVSGKSDMAMEQIQSACKAINGKSMPYFGIGDAPTAQELLALKEKGDFPAGIHTIHVTDRDGVVSGLHVQTMHDARVRNGKLEVLLDNQKGTAQDAGWVSLQKLYQVQQLNPPKEWTAIPEKYRGDFDSLKPVIAEATKPLAKHIPPAADSVTEASRTLPNGDVQGKWPDGGKYIDQTNSVGAHVRTNPEAQVERVTRTDGSVANAAYEHGKPIKIAETRDSQTTYWKPSAQKDKDNKEVVWISDQAPGQERRNMTLEANGNLTFNLNGEKHIVRSSGAELVEGKEKSSYDFDPSGRITRINYPDGRTSFGFDYRGQSNEVDAVTTYNRETNTKKVEKPDHTWGEPKVANDGTYSQVAYQWERSMGKQMFKGEQKFYTDGKSVTNALHYGGSVQISDSSGKVSTRAATQNDYVDIAAATSASLKETVEKEKPLEKPLPSASDSVTEARNALERAIDAGFKGHHGEAKSVRKAHEIMDSFERRSDADRKSGLVAPTDAQIAKAYRSAYETLINPGVMPYSDRQKLVLEGLRNISDPTGIDQGNHGSCGNTCGEKFIAVRNPDVYMSALEQVARDGTCKTKDGRVLKLPHDDQRQGNLSGTLMSWQRGWMPDSESRSWDVNKEDGWHPFKSNDGKRNYASQIIQNLNLADALESNRLGQRQMPAPVDALNFLNVEDFTKRMTGKPMTTINQQLETEGNIRQPLTDALALRLKQDGRLPAMVWRAFHWQTIHDVRTVPGRGLDPSGRPFGVVEVLSDNQWGNSKDRGWETVPELHRELAESP